MNAAVSKTVTRRQGVSRVRIPPPPFQARKACKLGLSAGRQPAEFGVIGTRQAGGSPRIARRRLTSRSHGGRTDAAARLFPLGATSAFRAKQKRWPTSAARRLECEARAADLSPADDVCALAWIAVVAGDVAASVDHSANGQDAEVAVSRPAVTRQLRRAGCARRSRRLPAGRDVAPQEPPGNDRRSSPLFRPPR